MRPGTLAAERSSTIYMEKPGQRAADVKIEGVMRRPGHIGKRRALRLWLLPVVLMIFMLLVLVGWRLIGNTGPVMKPSLVTGVADSRALNFESIPAMAAASDLVAQVTVEDVSPGTTSSTEADYRLRIEKVLVNRTGRTIDDRISDHELGHPAARGVWVEDSVIFQPGQQLILFLRQYAKGKFTTITGEQSAYVVHDGQVDSPWTAPVDHTPDFTGPMSLAAFEALVAGGESR